MKTICSVLLLTLFFSSAASFGSGTLVRNGGDILLTHLRALAESLNHTARLINTTPENGECQTLKNPLAVQKCSTLMKVAAAQLMTLTTSSKIKLVISDQPLKVPSKNSGEQNVSARTLLGPEGDIEFHRLSTETSSTRNLFFLLTHEYLHKVLFNGKYIGDDDSMEGFTDGRQLIDALAKNITRIAERNGLLAVEKGVRDNFRCTVQQDGKVTTAKLSSPRRFITTPGSTAPKFESSLGVKPLDATLAVGGSADSILKMQFFITAVNYCSPGAVFFPEPTTVRVLNSRDEVVAEQKVSFNPICSVSRPFGMKLEKVEWECAYLGAQGDQF